MSAQRILFSPVTRLSGLLSVEVIVEDGRIIDARASSTMFRGYEWIMRDRHVTDAVYMTQRVCGICSLAHGTAASYLLDELYDNRIDEQAQLLRNIMYGADFLQNHIRHFYLFSLPDFVAMPERPPFHGQDVVDCRLPYSENNRLAKNYVEAVKAAQKSHQILALFGGKAPHQHSFVHGGVAAEITADKINQALALCGEIIDFVHRCMLPDTELLAAYYDNYFAIGITPQRLLSFGLFAYGDKNQYRLWPGGVIERQYISNVNLTLISEDIHNSWYERDKLDDGTGLTPAPYKPGAYSWVKSVQYDGKFYEGGPLARMLLTGQYTGGTSTMDRIMARSVETALISELIEQWLNQLKPSASPLNQKHEPVKSEALAAVDAMRGPLLHSARIKNYQVDRYDIITPTVWNFSPQDSAGRHGPVERALIGTIIPRPELLYTIIGRTIRSFDPCLSCATHVVDASSHTQLNAIF